MGPPPVVGCFALKPLWSFKEEMQAIPVGVFLRGLRHIVEPQHGGQFIERDDVTSSFITVVVE